MSKRIKRRTICGRPVKGKIKWLPLRSTKNATNLFYVYELTEDGMVLAFYTGQLGFDQNGRKVDALYRSTDVLKHGGNPELYISILCAPMLPHANFQAEGESYAAQINARVEEASPWFASAGVRRGQLAQAAVAEVGVSRIEPPNVARKGPLRQYVESVGIVQIDPK